MTKKSCKICGGTYFARGFCKKHYDSSRYKNTLGLKVLKSCKICGGTYFAKGLCSKHYDNTNYANRIPEKIIQDKKNRKKYLDNRTSDRIKKDRKYQREWSRNPEVKLKVKVRGATPECKLRIRKRHLQRLKIDLGYKICIDLRNKIRVSIKNNRGKKYYHTNKYLGCSVPFFIEYFKELFKEGMSWSNYGIYTWHIDHIVPISKFNLEDPIQQKCCWHYTNLQPLWAKENISKGNKWEAEI